MDFERQKLLIEENPEPKSSNTIKERLNLHVKRRLEQITPHEYQQTVTAGQQQQQMQHHRQSNLQPQQKEIKKMRKPYQKRIDKINIQTQQTPAVATTVTQSSTEAAAAATVRKYTKRHKAKQLQQQQQQQITFAEGGRINNKSNKHFADCDEDVDSKKLAGLQAGETGNAEDDGGHETEMKIASAREKDKSPDMLLLGLVLNMKKRAIMQDPEVQEFFKNIGDIIKS